MNTSASIEFTHSNDEKFIFKVNRQVTTFSATESVRAIKYRPSEAPNHEEILFHSLKIASKKLKPEYKLPFLKTVIFVLAETQRRFIDNLDLFEDTVWNYWSVYNCKVKKEDKISDEIAIDVCERYLDLLSDDANHDWFERKVTGKDPGASREKETARVADRLKDLLKSHRNKVKNNTLSEEEKRIQQPLVRAKDMLMAWYNIDKAMDITIRLQKSWIPICLSRFVSGWLPEVLAGLFIGYVIWFRSTVFMAIWYWHPFGRDPLVLLIYALMGLASFISFGKLCSVKKTIDFQIFLPRMAAGIIVGYFALLGDEAWGGIFSSHSGWFIGGRLMVPCLAVLFYILIEMNNVKGIKYPIIKKAFRLFSRGASYAILTGMVISDLFGRAIVKRIPETAKVFKESNGLIPAHLHGLFGNVYPEVIFYLAPLALFIGVFVQLLWEDKTLTAKI